MPDREALTLDLHTRVYFPGDTVSGEVLLDLSLAQRDHIQEVFVILMGTLRIQIGPRRTAARPPPVGPGPTVVARDDQSIVLCHARSSLWTIGSAYPPPGSHLLPLRFALALPARPEPLPSFAAPTGASQGGYECAVRYWLAVIGRRRHAGAKVKLLFEGDRKIVRPLPVVRRDREGAEIKALLGASGGIWEGEWGMRSESKKVRRGLWGGHGIASAEIRIPNISSFPIATRIPYAIHVRTYSKPLTLRTPSAPPALFPPAPTAPSSLALYLIQRVNLSAYGMRHEFEDRLGALGALGPAASTDAEGHQGDDDDMRIDVGEWTWDEGPCERGRGRWRRDVRFEGAFVLKCTPTFSHVNVDVKHFLDLHVPFPGVGNSLDVRVPLNITSGMAGTPRTGVTAQEVEALPLYEAAVPPGQVQVQTPLADGSGDPLRGRRGGRTEDAVQSAVQVT